MKTIISTFGEEPEGIIQGIKQFGCENLILLVPEESSEKMKKGLERIEDLAKEMDIRLEKVKISPYSLMENIQKIKQLLNKNDGVILNITGGRKTLSLAAALAGFVANPSKIIYIEEESKRPIEIPRFTIYEKMLSPEKRIILKSIKNDMTMKEISKHLKKESKKPTQYHTIMKHLRELTEMGLVEVRNGRPHVYRITPSGELLR